MLLQVWGRNGAEDEESGGEGVPRFLRAGAGQPRALLPLQVSPLPPIPRNLLLLQGGRLWRNLLVWASLLALWTVLQELKTGNSRWMISRSNKGGGDVIIHAIWSPGRRRYRFFGPSLSPASRITESHSALNITRWGSRITCDGKFSLKESEEACWIGNFSRPNLKNEDDFLVKIQLTNLNDFDFHFEDCKVFSYYSSKTLNWFGSESFCKSDKRWI